MTGSRLLAGSLAHHHDHAQNPKSRPSKAAAPRLNTKGKAKKAARRVCNRVRGLPLHHGLT
jgi:hypothetical protein